jgi:hypothetical protein
MAAIGKDSIDTPAVQVSIEAAICSAQLREKQCE